MTKKFKLLIVLILCGHGIAILSKEDGNFYMGSIKFPFDIQDATSLCIYYNGNCIPVTDAAYIFKERVQSTINILVHDPEHIPTPIATEDNNVVAFRLNQHTSYRFYELKKIAGRQKELLPTFTWQIKEKRISKDNPKSTSMPIPNNTLMIPLEPSYVERLENSSWKSTSNLIKLPTIVIKECDVKKLNNQLIKSCLACVNLKPFHVQQKKKEIKQDNLMVSMIVD